ncbi:uncharacterized protein UTRI_10303 [Ustilago trichophora]|uniref:Uncharacterized protein n=1 Tax=Ustilago trichophora TaxID=86804 RepID=A0A5C3EQE3_9BASI|nr:uncharacterized protein UTRI_10303 [Ustilago trichophora]
MVSNKNKAKSKLEKERKAMYQAFKSHAQAISLPHLDSDESTPESAFQVIGGSIQVPGFSAPLMINLTLLDYSTGKPILQGFRPTCYKKKVAAFKSATKGLEFYKVAQETDKGKKTSRGYIHLGIWSEQGNFKYNFTSGTTHNANSAPLLTWARDSNEFFNHLLPFIHSDWHGTWTPGLQQLSGSLVTSRNKLSFSLTTELLAHSSTLSLAKFMMMARMLSPHFPSTLEPAPWFQGCQWVGCSRGETCQGLCA